jgi:hypothetical protein
MKNVIEQITIVTQQGVSITEVGTNNVAEIKNNSKEYPDHTEFIYDAYDKDGKLLRSIINCPVDITYL